MHGHNVPPTTIKEIRRFVHRKDLAHIDAALARRATGGFGTLNTGWCTHQTTHMLARFAGLRRGLYCAWGTRGASCGIAWRHSRYHRGHKQAELRLYKQVETERRVLAQISAGAPLERVLDELLRATKALRR